MNSFVKPQEIFGGEYSAEGELHICYIITAKEQHLQRINDIMGSFVKLRTDHFQYSLFDAHIVPFPRY
jgi:hypothetical protein